MSGYGVISAISTRSVFRVVTMHWFTFKVREWSQLMPGRGWKTFTWIINFLMASHL